jgi:hypothetical protein
MGTRTCFFSAILVFGCWLVTSIPAKFVGAADTKAPDDSVTTRWLPDPFPNIAPRVPDRYATAEMNKTFPTPSVMLGNYDVETHELKFVSFTKPSNGSAVMNDDGTFSYTPRNDFVGDDSFQFVLSDGHNGSTTATMHVTVIKPTGQWATTSFTGLSEMKAGSEPVRVSTAAMPRALDWDGDGLVDLLVGAEGRVSWYRNSGTQQAPAFAPGVVVEAGGAPIQFGKGRIAIAWIDMDRDGRRDLAFVADDRKVRWARNMSTSAGKPALAKAVVVQAKTGGDFVAEDVRAEIADWNGDGVPDVITGSFSGSVKVAYGAAADKELVFDAPDTKVDSEGLTVDGSYNLNVRIADLNQDGLSDFVDSYNWGNIRFRINSGTPATPLLREQGEFSVSGPEFGKLDMHALTDGPIVDFADMDGDGTIDMIVGGEKCGVLRWARGESGRSYLSGIVSMIAEHPRDLGPFLADPANANARSRMQTLQGALYDFVTRFATPSQKQEIVRGLLDLIKSYPQYFKLQTHDIKKQPGIPSLAAQVWLTTLVAYYENPRVRRALCDAAQMTGGYRKLVEDIGLIYIDNGQNPRGAEAIHQWVRTIPREIYPGTGITANDWLGGGRDYLVRGHLKNTFNGVPVDNGEYGFGQDAREIIGDRGSENWFMTVVHHEACHDIDAYVRKSPELNRRWGQMLVMAGGPDMCADPKSGWFNWDLTKRHFQDRGLWDGAANTWDAAWKKYWSEGQGAEWGKYGFMRGNISWFYGAPQESLATQGNQFWNSSEGRIEVAIDRWNRGFKSNLTEVLLFMEIWSLGYNKMKFCENDNACRQVISFAALRRNDHGYIDRVDLGDRYYEFAVNDDGVVTNIVHTPAKPASR